MAPRLIRRRRDGLVEIRRTRALDIVLSSDAFVLLGMFAGWIVFALVLVIVLVFDPPILAVAAWLVLALAVDARQSRTAPFAEAHVPIPPGAA